MLSYLGNDSPSKPPSEKQDDISHCFTELERGVKVGLMHVKYLVWSVHTLSILASIIMKKKSIMG